MRRSTVLLGASLTAWCGIPALAHGAPNAQELLQASSNAIRSARSYESVWLITSSMGSMGSMKMKMEMKMLPREHKLLVQTQPAQGGTGMMAMGAAMGQSTVVMDGKTLYVYMPMLHQYYKQVLSPEALKSMAGPINLPRGKGVQMKYLGARAFGGKPCDAVQISVPQTPQTKQMGMTISMVAYLDKTTHRMRGMKQTVVIKNAPPAAGSAHSGAGQGPMVVTTVMQVVSEKLNAPIPEKIFKFTPPPGATEMPMPSMPGKGSAPGVGMPGMGGGMMPR